MIHRVKLPQTTVYQSPLLRAVGVPHAFGTRAGDAGAIAADLGLHRHEPVTVAQVHGNTVATTSGGEADAVILQDAGQVTHVVTADCVPVLIASTDGRTVAAVHAGWRGLLAGVLENAAAHLDAPFLAAVGPCISAPHFEVGPEVAERFDPAHTHRPDTGNPCLDLPAIAAGRLHALGAQAVDRTDRCTYRDADTFFSYRRDVTHGGAPATGRMVNLIACKPG